MTEDQTVEYVTELVDRLEALLAGELMTAGFAALIEVLVRHFETGVSIRRLEHPPVSGPDSTAVADLLVLLKGLQVSMFAVTRQAERPTDLSRTH